MIVNLASLLSFDTELKQFAAIGKDSGDDNSHLSAEGKKTPWGPFRVFCILICIVAAVTQVMAINS